MLQLQLLIFVTLLELAYSGAPTQCQAIGFRIETTLDVAFTHDRECKALCINELIALQQHFENARFQGPNMLRKQHQNRNEHGEFFRIDQCLAWPRYCTQLQNAFLTPLTPISIFHEDKSAQPTNRADCSRSCRLKTIISHPKTQVPLSKCYCDVHLKLAQVRREPSKKMTDDVNFCHPGVICGRLNSDGRLDLGRINWQCQEALVLDESVACGEPADPCPCDGAFFRLRKKMTVPGSCRSWSMPLPTLASTRQFSPRTSGQCESVDYFYPPENAAAVRHLDEMNRFPQLLTTLPLQRSVDQANLAPRDDLAPLDDTNSAAGTSKTAIELEENKGLKRTASQASLNSFEIISYDELFPNVDFDTATSVLADDLLIYAAEDVNIVTATASADDVPTNPSATAADSEDDQVSIFGELQPILDLDFSIDVQIHERIREAKPVTGNGKSSKQRCYPDFL